MNILDNILHDSCNYEPPIDIKSIVKQFWIKIINFDLWKVDWILFWNYIWINGKLSEPKQRFVIAHEFCHFLLSEKWYSRGIFHSKEQKEKRADKFAMKLLLPEKTLLEAWEEYWNIPTLVNMFWVPAEVIKKRLNILF